MRTITILAILLSAPYLLAQPRRNDERKIPTVTYKTPGGIPLKAVTAIGLQSHIPIGIMLGNRPEPMCNTPRPFDIENATADEALREIAYSIGYQVTEDNGVVLITDPDLKEWQKQAMEHRYSDWSPQSRSTVPGLAIMLTGWLRMEVGHVTGFGASILYNPDARKYTLGNMPDASTTELANRIIMLGGGGIWMLRPDTANPKSVLDETIVAYSYRDDFREIGDMRCGQQ